MFDIEPQRHVLNPTERIRMSATDDFSKVVIYSPASTDIRLDVDVSHHEWTMIVLDDKHIAKPVVVPSREGSVIKMHPFNSDVLLIGTM